MAQTERMYEAKRDNKREKAKEARSRRSLRAGNVTWESADLDALVALIITVADEEGAVRIGRTRDGGAWAVGIYMGDDYATEYIRPSEDFAQAINEIAEVWLADNGLAFQQLYATTRKTR